MVVLLLCIRAGLGSEVEKWLPSGWMAVDSEPEVPRWFHYPDEGDGLGWSG